MKIVKCNRKRYDKTNYKTQTAGMFYVLSNYNHIIQFDDGRRRNGWSANTETWASVSDIFESIRLSKMKYGITTRRILSTDFDLVVEATNPEGFSKEFPEEFV